MSDRETAGLLQLGRPGLVRLLVLYAALTIALLAFPALMAQPRGEARHLSQQETPTHGRAR